MVVLALQEMTDDASQAHGHEQNKLDDATRIFPKSKTWEPVFFGSFSSDKLKEIFYLDRFWGPCI